MDALTALTPPLSVTPQVDADSILKGRQEEAFQQLEAVFVSMLIKELRTAGLEEGLFAGDSSDTFGGMFDSFMGDELARVGGIGLQSLLRDPVIPAAEDTSDTHRLAREAYGNAKPDDTISSTAGS